jgi:hypothetical protein
VRPHQPAPPAAFAIATRAMSERQENFLTVKGRRKLRAQLANVRVQAPSQSANFGAAPPSSFNFGASAPAVGGSNNTNGMFGASTNAFGGGATNSFPPAQSAAPSNTFSSSSFPAFGASSQTTGFNPQPPAANDFNFTASGANPFASANSAAMNGNGNGVSTAFGGSMFSQPPSNPFGGSAQMNTTSAASTSSMFGTNTNSAPSTGGMFGTMTTSAPPTNMFGTSAAPTGAPAAAPTAFAFGAPSSAAQTSGTPMAPSTPFAFGGPTSSAQTAGTLAAPSTPFAFGAASSSAQNPGTPATSNMFGGFNGTQNNATPAQTNVFSSFTQKEAPQSNMFGTGTSAQGTTNATATAPLNNMFGQFSNAQSAASTTTTAPSLNMFGTSGAPASAPASNAFGQLPKPESTPFTFGQQTPSAASNPFQSIKLPEEPAGTPKPSLFSTVKAPEQTASSETPKPNLFSSLAKPPPSTNGSASMFGAPQKDTTSEASEKPSFAPTLQKPEANKSGLFSGFSTPQPAKTSGIEKSQAGMFSAAQPKTSSLFSQTFQPETNNAGNAFKAPATFSGFSSQAKSSAEPEKDTPSQPASAKESSNPFSSLSAVKTGSSNLFATQKDQAPTPVASPMPTLTSSTTTSNGPELPKIPKAHVPKEWTAPAGPTGQNADSLFKLISSLTVQLQQLNERYRAKLTSLPSSADWAALSLWHHQQSSAIKKKIDIAKKQRAAEKGITGHESALSTKRKVNQESPEARDASPSKRARPAEVPATPTPQSTASSPKFNPPATATSNLFAKAINNKPSAAPEQSNIFAPKTAPAPAEEPSKSGFQPSAFKPSSSSAASSTFGGFNPSASTLGGSGTASSPFGGFKPTSSTSTSSSGSGAASAFSGFKPTSSTNTPSGGSGGFKPVTSSTGGGFASQFAATAKTFEQLAAERKKKAMDEDYDSDDETKAEWSARYDKKEAERLAKEKAAAAAAPAFTLPGSGKKADTSKSSSNPFAALPKPTSGASTPGLFGSRPASPALSASGSVFDAPSTAQTPSSNIFGHLSSGASSTNQDDSEDDGEQVTGASQNGLPEGSVEPTTPPKRKSGDSETEATESLDETAKRQKQSTTSKGSLFSRMSRDDDGSGSEKENSTTPTFGKANGTSTPTNKPFNFFDFGAAGAQTAPPKSDTFAGDQTFKVGTPIKFSETAATERKAPSFQFQAPSTSTTPSKPPPSNIFGSSTSGSSLLAPGASLFAGLNSAPSSTFSSRAVTPLSEADNSAAEDDEEGGKLEQVDLSKLTPEELAANDVVFETEQALAKQQVDQGDGTKAWENFARGPLYILKDKVTGKCFVRIRLPSGQIPLNYSILPSLKSNVTGSSGKMVQATMPKKEGGIAQFYISLKTKEIAQEFSARYNSSLPA